MAGMGRKLPLPQPPAVIPHIRHHGWTGEKMAIICETRSTPER